MAPRRPRAPAPSRLLPAAARLLPSLLLLLVQPPPLPADEARALLDYGEDLCSFQKHFSRARCVLQPAESEPCKIFEMPQENCYNNWRNCLDVKTFFEKEDFIYEFDDKRNLTNVTIWNMKVKDLILVTMNPEELWWKLEIPDREHNITIEGLPGHLNQTSPILLPVVCDGCPPPSIKWAVFRKMHQFKLLVNVWKDMPETNKTKLDMKVNLISSNDTIYSKDECKMPQSGRTINASTEEVITIGDVYSAEFCFVISIKFPWSRFPQYYACGRKENMTEVPYQPSHVPVEIPLLWIVILIMVIVALAIGSLVPLAVHRGVVRSPCKGAKRSRAQGERRPRAREERPFLQAKISTVVCTRDSVPGDRTERRCPNS